MKTIYQVVHFYTVDGGIGDAIDREDVIAVFEDRGDAEAFIERFRKPHVYDIPYQDLECGLLALNEICIYSKDECNLDEVDTEHFWWLHNKVLEPKVWGDEES